MASAALQQGVNFLLIGNPGVGKSTILNSLVGKALFKSGLSFGRGMTYQLDIQRPEGQPDTFMDTPGLSDTKLRKQAAEAITVALKQGGHFKIFFVLTLESGRVRPADVTTMKLVLDAAPITSYGVIVNQVPPGTMREIHENPRNVDPQPMESILQCLWGTLRSDQRSPWVKFVARLPDLEEQHNAVTELPQDLLVFVKALPGMSIDPAKVMAVREHEFEDQLKQSEETISKLIAEGKQTAEALALTRGQLERMSQQCKEQQTALARAQQERQEAAASFERQLGQLRQEGERREQDHQKAIEKLRDGQIQDQVLALIGSVAETGLRLAAAHVESARHSNSQRL
jgi:energy-coupling factor transporter ATP-binding protein EcfA2